MREKFEKEIENLKRAAMNDKQGILKELQAKIDELESKIKLLLQQLDDEKKLNKEAIQQLKNNYETQIQGLS